MAEIAFTNADDDIALFSTEPSALITNTSISVVFAPRFSNFTVPSTFNFAVGLFVPIPILPLESIRIASLLFVFMIRGLLSTVPKKFAAVVPLFPFSDQLLVADPISASLTQAPLLLILKLLSAVK